MPVPSGATFLGVARETTRGIYVPPTDFVPVDPSNYNSPNDLVHSAEDSNLRGSAVKAYNEIPTAGWAEPSFSGNVFPDTLPFWLKALLGEEVNTVSGGTATTLSSAASAGATSVVAVANPGGAAVGSTILIGSATDGEFRVITSVTGTGPYTLNFTFPLDRAHAGGAAVLYGPGAGVAFTSAFSHIFTLRNAGDFQPPSYSLTDYNGDVTKGIPGCMVATLTLKWSATGLLSYDVKITGLGSAAQSKPTQSFSGEVARPGFESVVTLAGSGNQTLIDAEVTIAREVEVIVTADGSAAPYAVWGNVVDVSGKGTFVYEAATYAAEYAKFLAGTPTTLAFDWQDGAGVNLREIKLAMSNVLYTAFPSNRGKAYVEAAPTFKADGNTTDVGPSGGWGPCVATVKNGKGKTY